MTGLGYKVRMTRVAPLLSGLVLFTGCAEDEGPADPCVLRLGADCSVQDDECVAHAHAVVACMRGEEHALPKVVRVTAEEFAASQPEPEAPTEDEAKQRAQVDLGMQLLGLLPAGYAPPEAEDGATVVAPYIGYDWETKVLTIVADGADPERELMGLVYTLVVADRDAEVGLAGLLSESRTFDGDTAIRALLAGEATFYTDMAGERDSDYAALAETFSYFQGVGYVNDLFADRKETWGLAISAFYYYYGAAATLARFVAGGPEAVSAGYAETTGSSAYALAGSDDIEAMFSAVETELPAAPEGFRYLIQDSMGPVVWFMSSVRLAGDIVLPNELQALGREWVGDRLVIAGEIDGDEVAVVWQLATADGQVAMTRVLASDVAVQQAFAEAFGA